LPPVARLFLSGEKVSEFLEILAVSEIIRHSAPLFGPSLIRIRDRGRIISEWDLHRHPHRVFCYFAEKFLWL
jgi:hypothetical protein